MGGFSAVALDVSISTALLACACSSVAYAANELPVAPKLNLTKTLNGPAPKELSWTALSGKVVVIEFWATWCAPCVGAIPHWNELVDKFADKPVKFLSITRDEDSAVRRFLHKRPIRGWVGLDETGVTSSAYGGSGIPRTVIVNAQGRIVAVTSPWEVTEQVINDVLAGKPLNLAPPSSRGQVSATPTREAKDQEPPLFEVVVRRSSSSNRRSNTSGRTKFEATGWSVRSVAAFVRDIPKNRVIVPDELSDRYYDVRLHWAQTGGVVPRALLKQILTPAFGITTKNERREVEVYVLSVPNAKNLKLARTAILGSASYSNVGSNYLSGINLDLTALARSLESVIETPVLNETQLSGGFDWTFRFEPGAPESVLEAVGEQLGLSITKSHREIEFVVVEPVGRNSSP